MMHDVSENRRLCSMESAMEVDEFPQPANLPGPSTIAKTVVEPKEANGSGKTEKLVDRLAILQNATWWFSEAMKRVKKEKKHHRQLSARRLEKQLFAHRDDAEKLAMLEKKATDLANAYSKLARKSHELQNDSRIKTGWYHHAVSGTLI